MAVSNAQALKALKYFIQNTNTPANPEKFDKTTLKSVFTAIDTWYLANVASYNAALPAAFRNNATANEKAQALYAYLYGVVL